MSESITKIIQQAEIQKLQLQLQLNFVKNMGIFEKRFPAIFAAMKDRKPSATQLRIDAQGQINLYDLTQNKFLYDTSPSNYCREQVDAFIAGAKTYRLRVTKNEVLNKEHLHVNYLNRLIDIFNDSPAKRMKTNEKNLYTLIMSGIGLGFHLPELIRKLNIHNLFIFESCLDTFHASLHIIDWSEILDYFTEHNRTITFCLGVTPERALEQIETTLDEIGLHNFIFSYLYQHTHRAAENAFLGEYKTKIHHRTAAMGFYDDEQIGLAHTLASLRSGHATFKGNVSTSRDISVFIIGNGPSLDTHKAFLKKNRENAIYISCGTALAPLFKLGITPDFHVEMERTITAAAFIEEGTTEAYRKDIPLLCLHTVSPKAMSFFNEVCYAIKPNDAGSMLIKEYFTPDPTLSLSFCNPTVSNTGIAFAVAMGFTNIHLIGVDLGVKKDGQHHSEHSTHNTLEKHASDKNPYIYSYQDDKSTYVDGNFGDQVKTHPTLNLSRFVMERFLKNARESISGFKCSNSNDGARIMGATPTPIEELIVKSPTNKEGLIKELKDQYFLYKEKSDFDSKRNNAILEYFFNLEKSMFISPDVSCEADLYGELQRIYKLVNIKNDYITHYLLKGTLNAFFGSFGEHTFYCEDNEEFKTLAAKGIKLYNELITNIYTNMKEDPFRPDNTRHELFDKLRESNVQETIKKTIKASH